VSSQYTSTLNRENVQLSSDFVYTHTPDIVTLLLDALRPKLREYIVHEIAGKVKQELNDLHTDPKKTLWEMLHKKAFRGANLGNSLFCPDDRIDEVQHLNLEKLEQFILERYVPENVVIVAAGVPHERAKRAVVDTYNELGKLADPTPENWQAPVRDPVSSLAAKYYGGEDFCTGHLHSNNYFALGFEGVSSSDKDWYALQVLVRLLGKGTSASLVGPGHNGNASLLGKNLVTNNSDKNVEEITAFEASYSDAGLFGVYGEVKDHHHDHNKATGNAIKTVTELLGDLKNKVDENELNRAIKQTKVCWLKSAETPRGLSDFIGKQILSGVQHPLNPDKFINKFDNISAADIQRVVKRVTASNPTLAVIGDFVNVPTIGDVRKILQKDNRK